MVEQVKTPRDITEPFKELLKAKGVSWEQVEKESSRMGVPPIKYIAEVKKLFDYDEIAKEWSRLYGIPYSDRAGWIEQTSTYVRYKDGGIGIWSPYFYRTVKEKFPDAKVYLVPYYFFEIKEDAERAGWFGEFLEIVKSAKKIGVSDIHFEVKKDVAVVVKFRLMGELRQVKEYSLEEWSKMQYAVKNEAKRYTALLDAQEWRIRQDARIEIPDLKLDLRLAFTPSLQDGLQNLVVRLLSKSPLRPKGVEDLESLGYARVDAYRLLSVNTAGSGLVVMCGATGTGKSRTMNTIIGLIPESRNVRTAEDPVEYVLSNAVQHQINVFTKDEKQYVMGYLEYLLAFMRQDPDVIFIGEWRKMKELTEGLIYACETGHLTMTTLHSSRVVNVANLLVSQYGVKQTDLANNLLLLISQRLVKTVCPNCGIRRKIEERDVDVRTLRFKDKEKLLELVGKEGIFPNPDGCEKCRVYDPFTGKLVSAGYSGRTAIYEYLYATEELRRLLLETTDSLKIEELLLELSKEREKKLKEAKKLLSELKKKLSKEEYKREKDSVLKSLSIEIYGKTFVDTAVEKVLAQKVCITDAVSKLE